MNTPHTSISGETLLEMFLRGLSPSTIRAYQSDLSGFSTQLGHSSIPEALTHFLAQDKEKAHALVLNYRSTSLEAQLSPATINRRLSVLKSIVRFAYQMKMISWELSLESVPLVLRKKVRGASPYAVSSLLKATGDGRKVELKTRDSAMILLMALNALSCAEVVGLNIKDLDLKGKRAFVHGNKGRSSTWVCLPDQTVEALRLWLVHRGEAPGAVFIALDRAGRSTPLTTSSARRMMKLISKKVGCVVRPHDLRSAAISAALERGYDVRAVQRFARHLSVSTTLNYEGDTHVSVDPSPNGVVRFPIHIQGGSRVSK